MASTTTPTPYRLTTDEGLDKVWWKSGQVIVKATGAQTDGAFSQIVTDDPRGTGTPLHLHQTDDEAFYVLDGEVSFFVGDERIDARAGDYCFVPHGTAHAYLIRSESARMLVTMSRAGIEELFVSLGVPVTDAEPPADAVLPPMDEMVRLFADYGCDILGPPPSA